EDAERSGDEMKHAACVVAVSRLRGPAFNPWCPPAATSPSTPSLVIHFTLSSRLQDILIVLLIGLLKYASWDGKVARKGGLCANMRTAGATGHARLRTFWPGNTFSRYDTSWSDPTCSAATDAPGGHLNLHAVPRGSLPLSRHPFCPDRKFCPPLYCPDHELVWECKSMELNGGVKRQASK
ncbi:hypothetical protein PV326_005767, partial [Microctonus aethiopoides]